MPAFVAALVLLHGVVMRGPITPVCQVGKPCSEPAAGATLVFSRNGSDVTRVVADARGRYRVRLRAGLYSVRLARQPRIGSGLSPRSVKVPAVQSVRADFDIDTGIR